MVEFAGKEHYAAENNSQKACAGQQCEIFHLQNNVVDKIAYTENASHYECRDCFTEKHSCIPRNHQYNYCGTDDISGKKTDMLRKRQSHQIEKYRSYC